MQRIFINTSILGLEPGREIEITTNVFIKRVFIKENVCTRIQSYLVKGRKPTLSRCGWGLESLSQIVVVS